LSHILSHLIPTSSHLSTFFFSFYCSRAHRDLHSFPTRRSSDLSEGFMLQGGTVTPGPVAGQLTAPRVARAPLSPAEQFHLFLRRSEEHTSELQSPYDLVCRLLLEKKKKKKIQKNTHTTKLLAVI